MSNNVEIDNVLLLIVCKFVLCEVVDKNIELKNLKF